MTDKKKAPDAKSRKKSPTDSETDFTKDPLSTKIGTSLRRMYDDVVNEPVPDDFLNLLAKADKKAK